MYKYQVNNIYKVDHHSLTKRIVNIDVFNIPPVHRKLIQTQTINDK